MMGLADLGGSSPSVERRGLCRRWPVDFLWWWWWCSREVRLLLRPETGDMGDPSVRFVPTLVLIDVEPLLKRSRSAVLRFAMTSRYQDDMGFLTLRFPSRLARLPSPGL